MAAISNLLILIISIAKRLMASIPMAVVAEMRLQSDKPMMRKFMIESVKY